MSRSDHVVRCEGEGVCCAAFLKRLVVQLLSATHTDILQDNTAVLMRLCSLGTNVCTKSRRATLCKRMYRNNDHVMEAAIKHLVQKLYENN